MNWDELIKINNFDWMLVKSGDQFAAFDPFGLGGGWCDTPANAIAALEQKKQRRREFLKKGGVRVRPHNGKPFNRKNRARRRL